jgi:hypothetical protein
VFFQQTVGDRELKFERGHRWLWFLASALSIADRTDIRVVVVCIYGLRRYRKNENWEEDGREKDRPCKCVCGICGEAALTVIVHPKSSFLLKLPLAPFGTSCDQNF